MRHSLRAPLSMLLVIVCSHHALAQSSAWRLWPFGSKEEATVTAAPPTTTAPTFTPSPSAGLPPSADITPVGPRSLPTAPQTTAPQYEPREQAPAPQLPQTPMDSDRPPIVESPFANMKWPKLRMPQRPSLRPSTTQQSAASSQTERPRNAWVEKAPEPPKPTAMQSLANGAQRVGNRTRETWRKTVDAITPGEPDPRTPPSIASRDIKPPFWKRMLGAEEAEPQGPQTIPQWMAQDRVDP